jgi:hypothetical protein
MTLSRSGGLAAITCAATYMIGFALLVTVLAPFSYGTNAVDAMAVAAFIDESPSVLIAWNTTIYIVNALALVVLVVALAARTSPDVPGLAAVAHAAGLIWAALVLGAGMVANVAVERAAHLYPTDPERAAALWSQIHAVELGLGGGNEVAGGFWLLCVSAAGWRARALPRHVAAIGGLAGAGGLATVLPPLGETAGALFGLGAIVWFIAVGVFLLRSEPEDPAR